MPTTTYMVVDPRHDHSMRIPRPDRTAMLGTPNACNSCHTDKTATWAQDAIRSWFPTPNPGAQDFAEAFERGELGAPGAQKALQSIAAAGSTSAIARASAIGRLSRYPSLDVLNMAAQALKIEDPLVRSAAIQVIAGADTATRRTLLVPLLRDKTKLVRMDAARALVGDAQPVLPADEAIALQKALEEYVEAQLFNAERPEAHANLGSLYRAQGKLQEARAAFELAIKIDPAFLAAFVSLAEIARSQGDEREAEAILRQALLKDVGAGMIHHALGLSLIRQKRTAEALTSLASAAEVTPEDPLFIYVLAIAQHDTGKRDEAIATLSRALVRHPYDRDILWALASYEFEARDYSAALKRAELLLELEPERADVVQLVGALKRQMK
jgi:Tfp pilus assembly protein PilF